MFTSHLGSSDVEGGIANQRLNKPHEKHRKRGEVEELDEDVENYHDS